jgi:type I restriction enzyme M protein
VQDTHRLALMNLMLHGIDGGIRYGDTSCHRSP